MSSPTFAGARVLVLESRRARELGALVTTYGGVAIVAPSMREVPLDSNADALAFAAALEAGGFDIVILLTGVGTRAMLEVVDSTGRRDAFVAALGRVKLAARGPKPVAVLRELGLQPWVVAPEPNTWRELLAALDVKAPESSLRGARVAVQEYGAPSPDLAAGLSDRGARVTSVPVYRWAMPEDLGPLQAGVRALADGAIDSVLFTSATQAVHLLQVADEMHLGRAVRDAVARCVVASIGPTTSEELLRQGIRIDMEPSHPKMGFLAREAAEQYADLRVRIRPSAT
jgi:uroporphyrinogen-III synthase